MPRGNLWDSATPGDGFKVEGGVGGVRGINYPPDRPGADGKSIPPPGPGPRTGPDLPDGATGGYGWPFSGL